MAALVLAAALRAACVGARAAPLVSPWLGGARPLALVCRARALCAASDAPRAGAPADAGSADDGLAGAAADADADEWAALGMAPELLNAVVGTLGHARPTPIQVRAFAAIRDPAARDVVIAGETGIGKTLAYLLPALDALLVEAAGADAHAEGTTAAAAAADDEDHDDHDASGRELRGALLVLQPNADLAYQAAAVAAALLRGTALDGGVLNLHEPHEFAAVSRAHVLLGTPPRLLDALLAHAERLGPRVRCAVLDEADALLAGSFKVGARQKYPVEQLLLALRLSLIHI